MNLQQATKSLGAKGTITEVNQLCAVNDIMLLHDERQIPRRLYSLHTTDCGEMSRRKNGPHYEALLREPPVRQQCTFSWVRGFRCCLGSTFPLSVSFLATSSATCCLSPLDVCVRGICRDVKPKAHGMLEETGRARSSTQESLEQVRMCCVYRQAARSRNGEGNPGEEEMQRSRHGLAGKWRTLSCSVPRSVIGVKQDERVYLSLHCRIGSRWLIDRVW